MSIQPSPGRQTTGAYSRPWKRKRWGRSLSPTAAPRLAKKRRVAPCKAGPRSATGVGREALVAPGSPVRGSRSEESGGRGNLNLAFVQPQSLRQRQAQNPVRRELTYQLDETLAFAFE